MERVNRRRFLQVASIGVAGVALSACGKEPAETENLHPTMIPDVAGAPPTPAPSSGTPEAGGEEEAPETGGVPAATLEAHDPYAWSTKELSLSPGQTLIVKNVGVLEHDFSVDEWSIEDPLPSGQEVEVTVPSDVAVGDTFTFYCSIPGHREGGMEGTITIVEQAAAPPAGEGEATPVGEATPAAPPEATPAAEGAAPPPASGPVVLEAQDPFSWSPKELSLSAGQVLTVKSVGVLEHDFSVDEWGVNDPLPGGAEVQVTVPADATAGQTLTFYCSIPGHRESGMEGTITIV